LALAAPEALAGMAAAGSSCCIETFRIRGNLPPCNQMYHVFYSLLNLLYKKIGLLIPSQIKQRPNLQAAISEDIKMTTKTSWIPFK